MTVPHSIVSFPIMSEWKVKRPFLYRYLEKQWVDAFFNTGSLRLSSFNQFSKHKDEQRFDGNEGFGVIQNKSKSGQFVSAVVGQGSNSYVLCTSTLFSNSIAKDFNTDSGFRINDILGFCNAISRHVPGFWQGVEGSCSYIQNKIIQRKMASIDIDSMIIEGTNDIDGGQLFQSVFNLVGDDFYFVKDLKYSPQSEYRLLWFVQSPPNLILDIKCPEALQFCTRFEEL